MPTTLYLRNTNSVNNVSNGDEIIYDMLPTAGSSVATAVVNLFANQTNLRWTSTAGGSFIAWVSGYASSAFTLTSIDISAWLQESNMNANAGARVRFYKKHLDGTETLIGGGPFDDGVEFSTSAREDTWTANVTDTAFAVNDRLVVRFFATNIGTMGDGYTATLSYNAAGGATGDSFITIAETVTFSDTVVVPSRQLDTVDANDFGGDTTPTVEFTSNTGLTSDIEYEIGIQGTPAATAHRLIYSANSSWTVPAGVTSVVLEAWGAGGGGQTAGGSGGGGAAMTKTLAVSQGDILDIFVGTGAVNTDGGDSYVQRSGVDQIRAKGGKSRGNGGAGGLASEGIGDSGSNGIAGTATSGSAVGGASGTISGISGLGGPSNAAGTLYGGGGGSTTTTSQAGNKGVVHIKYDRVVTGYPTVVGVAGTQTSLVSSISYNSWPSGQNGDLLIVTAAASLGALNYDHNITNIAAEWNGGVLAQSGQQILASFWKFADGTDTLTFDYNTLANWNIRVMRIKNGGQPVIAGSIDIDGGSALATASLSFNLDTAQNYPNALGVLSCPWPNSNSQTSQDAPTSSWNEYWTMLIPNNNNYNGYWSTKFTNATAVFNPDDINYVNGAGNSAAITYLVPFRPNSAYAENVVKTSAADAGFANTVNGADTNPFTKNQKISYTAQSALATGTYNWTVLAKAVSGDNNYRFSAPVRTFLIGSSSPVLTAQQASFSLIGQAANLLMGRNVIANQTNFTLTGQDAILARGKKLLADQATFSLNGQTSTLIMTRLLSAAQAAFSLAGQAAGLLLGRKVTADQASFTLSGQPSNLNLARKVIASLANFTLSGQAASLEYNRIMPATQVGFALNGQDATLRRGYGLPVDVANFALSGQASGLLLARKLLASQAGFSLSGNNANTLYARVMAAGRGDFSLLGQNANLSYGKTLQALQASYTFAGQAANLRAARVMIANHGAFALNGQDATLTKTAALKIIAETAYFALTGQNNTLTMARKLIADYGAYALIGQDAALRSGRVLSSDLGAFALNPQPATLNKAWLVNAETGLYTLLGMAAGLTYTGFIAPALCWPLVATILNSMTLESVIGESGALKNTITESGVLDSGIAEDGTVDSEIVC